MRMRPNKMEQFPPHNVEHSYIEPDGDDAFNFGSCDVSPKCVPAEILPIEARHG